MPKQNPNETVDRVWRIRNLVKERIVQQEQDEKFKEHLDVNLDLYIAKYGLPTEYSSKEELLEDLRTLT